MRRTLFGLAVGLLFAGVLGAGPLGANAAPTATNLDGTFGLNANPNIFDSTTVPHATVTGSIANYAAVAWYSFTGTAGARLYVDHDGGINGDATHNSFFSLFRSSGELIAFADLGTVDPGSEGGIVGQQLSEEAFLGTVTLPATDIYYLAISVSDTFPIGDGCTSTGIPFTRPDGQSAGGYPASDCTDRTFGFVAIGSWPIAGSYTVHFSLSSATVPDPGTMLQKLAGSVADVGPGKSLADKVALAQTYFAVPDIQASCAVLTDFVTEVSAQRGKKIATDLADKLTADAGGIMEAIGCN